LPLALPVWRGEARAQDEKEPPPQKRYAALVQDFSTQQRELITAINKAKGDERTKLIQKYTGLAKEFAEKFYKLAEDAPKDAAAADALFWVLQNGSGSAVYQKSVEKMATLIEAMPLQDLARRLRMVRVGNVRLMESVLQRAEKDENDPQAGDLLAWIATTGGTTSAAKKATERLVQKYPDNPAIERLCQTLANNRSGQAAETLKQILEKSTKDRVKAAAAFGLGKQLAAQTDKLGDKVAEANKVAAEAEKYLVQAIDLFGTTNAALKNAAEKELKALRTLRVGKEAPEITATDLDEKEFKLSDYRGKVVLLDFWGNW
jgi:hypothetical protein